MATFETARTAKAEGQQLTVLFCELVRLSDLAAHLIRKTWGAVLRAYQDAAASEITRFDGRIAK